MKKKVPEEDISCSFCHKQLNEVEHIIAGPGVYICNQCIDQGKEVIERKERPKEEPVKEEGFLSPKAIHQKLDDYVIGQENVKKALSVSVYNHYKRIQHNINKKPNDVELDKSNILLIGPTGSGKTLLASTLARTVNVPFAIADATTLTEAGYVGDDVENILLRLIQNADWDVARAERGIIFIDEIDKIGRKSENTSITRDVSGEGVQQALLKIIEGTTATVPAKGGRKHPQSNNISINTENILFVCGGAFVGLENIVQQRLHKQVIGFNSKLIEDKENVNILTETVPDDLMKFGLIPELIGRLPVISALQELDDEALKLILTEPKNSLIRQYKKLLSLENKELDITDDGLDAIIEKAKELKTGARGLRSVMEYIMTDIFYEAPDHKDKKVTLSRRSIENKDFFRPGQEIA